jgi:hypothetical protein
MAKRTNSKQKSSKDTRTKMLFKGKYRVSGLPFGFEFFFSRENQIYEGNLPLMVLVAASG